MTSLVALWGEGDVVGLDPLLLGCTVDLRPGDAGSGLGGSLVVT